MRQRRGSFQANRSGSLKPAVSEALNRRCKNKPTIFGGRLPHILPFSCPQTGVVRESQTQSLTNLQGSMRAAAEVRTFAGEETSSAAVFLC